MFLPICRGRVTHIHGDLPNHPTTRRRRGLGAIHCFGDRRSAGAANPAAATKTAITPKRRPAWKSFQVETRLMPGRSTASGDTEPPYSIGGGGPKLPGFGKHRPSSNSTAFCLSTQACSQFLLCNGAVKGSLAPAPASCHLPGLAPSVGCAADRFCPPCRFHNGS